MNKTKRKLVLGLVGFLCSLVVVVLSASAQTRGEVFGLILGSFAAGGAFVNLIRDWRESRAAMKAGSAGDQGAEALDCELRSPAEKQPAPDPAASEYSSATTEQPRR